MIEATAAHYGEAVTHLLERGRTAPQSRKRHVAMYLATELTGRSLPRIGLAFRRDHTTIMHGRDRIAGLLATCAATRADVDAIRARLLGRGPQPGQFARTEGGE